LAAEPKDSSGRLYHIGLRKEDVGRVALLPGDPARVLKIAKHLDRPRRIASHREYLSYGGYIDKEYVVAMSTGIGGPSTAIAVEELSRPGVDTMIRVGTTGAIQPELKLGDLVIVEASVRMDGTSRQYAMEGYPAAASPEVVIALRDSSAALKKRVVSGISATTDSFYVGQGRPGFRSFLPLKSKSLVDELRSANVLCFEMESSTIFTLGRIYGLRTGTVLAVIANRTTNEFRPDAGVQSAIEVAVDSVRRMKRKGILAR
jgi:uridine phosphorylase